MQVRDCGPDPVWLHYQKQTILNRAKAKGIEESQIAKGEISCGDGPHAVILKTGERIELWPQEG